MSMDTMEWAANRAGMSKIEYLKRYYASYTDESLIAQIALEQEKKQRPYHPEEIDIMKRGSNPTLIDEMIADMQAVLDARRNEREGKQ